jgi:hypothetical protein
MAASAPTRCATALKEWATVLRAMATGEQVVLIRKGGLIEPGSGFEVISPSFIFYPTFEHQAVQYLRAPYQSYFNEAAAERAPEGQVRVSLYGEAVRSVSCRDPAVVTRLQEHHIYNDAFLTQRLKWQPDQPLAVVVVRAYRLAQPLTLPVSPRYAGCKSWVELEAPASLGALQPVLDDAAFAQRLCAIEPLLPVA